MQKLNVIQNTKKDQCNRKNIEITNCKKAVNNKITLFDNIKANTAAQQRRNALLTFIELYFYLRHRSQTSKPLPTFTHK